MTNKTKMFLAMLALAPSLAATAAHAQAVPPAYKTNCQMCHQTGAKGVPGLYPRLSGRIDEIAVNADGRKWVLSVLLNGQTGKAIVDGKPLSGFMAAYARLPDKDLADLLNYVTSAAGKAKSKPFTAAEIKAARGWPKMTAAQVGEQRAALVKSGVIK
jgi:mono/diheme cytochrome c family protein